LKQRVRPYLLGVRIVALCLLIVALARPQAPIADEKAQTEGIDIVLALDCSTSMRAEDFTLNGQRRNRVEVITSVVENFIKGREHDRIGIVAFAGRAYTLCPLTLDYDWLLSNLSRLHAGMIEDGTAIGSGLAASVNRLRNSNAKSKIIILLTDGRNNAGAITPLVAAQAAQAVGVKVYTIGAGSKGPVPYPVAEMFGRVVYEQVEVDLDEETLKSIADTTGGAYFRATDTQSLTQIYAAIDRMEKTPIEEKGYRAYEELFPYFLVPALMLLVCVLVVNGTLLRAIP